MLHAYTCNVHAVLHASTMCMPFSYSQFTVRNSELLFVRVAGNFSGVKIFVAQHIYSGLVFIFVVVTCTAGKRYGPGHFFCG